MTNWDRKLSRPIGRFTRIRDVRDYILKTWPHGAPQAWHYIGEQALAASKSGDTKALEIALMLAGAQRR